MSEAVVTWRERDLSEEIYKYLYIDGVNFKMRIHGSIELVPVLVVTGVSQEGFRSVLGLQLRGQACKFEKMGIL